MKEFDYPLENIFNGLVPEKDTKKNKVGLLDCHNLEPLGQDYGLHEFVVDMNSDSYAWGNP
jgi:hypothetical protein